MHANNLLTLIISLDCFLSSLSFACDHSKKTLLDPEKRKDSKPGKEELARVRKIVGESIDEDPYWIHASRDGHNIDHYRKPNVGWVHCARAPPLGFSYPSIHTHTLTSSAGRPPPPPPTHPSTRIAGHRSSFGCIKPSRMISA